MRRTLAVLLALAASPALPATWVASSIEETARSADVVVHGHVAAVSARAVAGGRRIVTDVDVAVESAWKGAAPAAVRVVVPGGRVGDLELAVDAAPRFAPGEEVVLFLSRRGPVYGLAGLGLGKYAVRGGEARPALGPEGALPGALPAGERAAGPVTLAELERRVRAAR